MRFQLQYIRLAILGAVLVPVSACSIKDLVDVGKGQREDVFSDEYVRSRPGAVGVVLDGYRLLQSAVSELSLQVALVTDELTLRPISDANHQSSLVHLDARNVAIGATGSTTFFSQPALGGVNSIYTSLTAARVQAMQGRDLLAPYPDDTLAKYRALAYVIEGYADLLLAENFCGGVPLSTARYDADIEYSPARTTAEVFRAARYMFDSAAGAVPGDSIIETVARIGRMRALLGEGNLDSAFALSEHVRATFMYVVPYSRSLPVVGAVSSALFWTDTVSYQRMNSGIEIVNHEGGAGRQWYDPVTGTMDPRVPIKTTMVDGVPVIPAIARPAKFAGGAPQFPLARGLEALLVQAEYYASHGGDWLTPLNTARRQIGMADTSAPAVADSTVDLIFRERAAWFYLEGRRLSDYRRLVRHYGRDAYSVYPTGSYTRGPLSISVYGSAYVFTPDALEIENNYRYNGCLTLNP